MRFLALSFSLFAAALAGGAQPFGIQVMDETSGHPVPMVVMETVHGLRYVTDSNGYVAFDEPGMLGRRVFFSVASPGYTFPKDNFGFAGLALDTTPGALSTIKLVRTNIAERLYRVTGQGIYRDTVMLGKDPPLPQAQLNGGVLAQGGVQSVVYQGKLLWLWGDTKRPAHPMDNMRGTGAVSDLPGKEGLDPAIGIHFTYFTNDRDEPQAMLAGKEPGSVRFDGVVNVKDMAGTERVVMHYARVDTDGKVLEQGIAEWNPQQHEIERLIVLSEDYRWQFPQGQAVRVTDDKAEIFYFATPYCTVRVPATYESMVTPSSYEALAYDDDKGIITWQKTNPPLTRETEERWISKKLIKWADGRVELEDADSEKGIEMKSGSVRWNAWRKAYLLIAADDKGGVWYAESRTVDGPWRKAVMIATHNGLPFTSVCQHDVFDQKDGQTIYFEGVIGDPASARYDCNAVMYRLELGDDRLNDARVR